MTEFDVFSAGSSESQIKKGLAYLFAQSSVGRAATGVLGGLGVTQTPTASSSIIVGAGSAIVQPSTTSGASWPTSDADKTIDVLTPSPMGALPRNDLVVFDIDADTIRVEIGTANASPVDPTVSANHIKLARIRNAASATSIPNSAIDDLRVFTSLAPSMLDSGWVNVTISSGFAAEPGYTPQVRKVGNKVTIAGGWDNVGFSTNSSFNVGVIPAGYRPSKNMFLISVGATGNQIQAIFTITASTGVVQVRTGGGLSDTYQFDGQPSWFID